MPTSVDAAMADDRPAKQAVRRGMWLDALKRRASTRSGEVPLYVTLAGAEGRDIDMMVDEGLIELTETGAIASKSLRTVIAIESNSDARSQLLEKFYGLEVLPDRFESLIRGDSQIRYPTGRDIEVWRSAVINLDLNQPLVIEQRGDDSVACGLIENVVKIATIQRSTPQEGGWSLLLTLHGALLVRDAEERTKVSRALAHILEVNFAASSAFAERFVGLTGAQPDADWLEGICTIRGTDDDPATEAHRQLTLLMLVPKLIVDRTAGMGWAISVTESAHYGGQGDAPMVTWSIDFSPTSSAGTSGRIASALSSVGNSVSLIEVDGTKVAV